MTENLKNLPKAELHRHLELTMRHDTMKAVAHEVGITIHNQEQFHEYFLITQPMNDLSSVLKKFTNTQKLFFKANILEQITYEAIEDAYHDGIRILELRYAPTFIQSSNTSLTFDMIHKAIYAGMTKAKKEFPIAVGLLCTIQRILPVKLAESVVDLAINHKDTIMGIDLADNEVGHDLKPFAKAFQRAKAHGLRITAHSGEANIPQAPTNVKDAIDYLGAERIGHGVQIYRRDDIMDYVIQKDVTLELCPTSNWLTQAVPSQKQHPFRQLFDHGVHTTINSDDPSVFDIDLTHEYQLLARLQNFTEEELHRCNDYAVSASFIDHREKQAAWPRPIL